jgi:tetratricopeptide (TPR) repeat protein
MAKRSSPKVSRPTRKKAAPRRAAPVRRAPQPSVSAVPAAAERRAAQAAASAAPPARKPSYYEAIAIYETGVRALQRHEFEKAADQFRQVISRYPSERELHERSLLYLRVCERETERRTPAPQTAQERIYAATMALNAGDHQTAIDHLRRAVADAPESDDGHYVLAVALAAVGQTTNALGHLRRAIELNPDNRSLARQDPDLEDVRELPECRGLLDAPPPATGAAPRAQRRRR